VLLRTAGTRLVLQSMILALIFLEAYILTMTMYTIDYYFTLYTADRGVQSTGTRGFQFAQGSH